VITALYCGNCGKRCGTATLRSDRDHVDVSAHRRRDSIMVVRRLSEPAGWPVEFICHECRQTVRLELEQAQRAGKTSRLVVR
jgi:hypothetical protein